jgi:hypothetical protein
MDNKLTSSSSHQMTAGFRKNKMAEPDEQWVYSGGETPIRKLPDMLLV